MPGLLLPAPYDASNATVLAVGTADTLYKPLYLLLVLFLSVPTPTTCITLPTVLSIAATLTTPLVPPDILMVLPTPYAAPPSLINAV